MTQIVNDTDDKEREERGANRSLLFLCHFLVSDQRDNVLLTLSHGFHVLAKRRRVAARVAGRAEPRVLRIAASIEHPWHTQVTERVRADELANLSDRLLRAD